MFNTLTLPICLLFYLFKLYYNSQIYVGNKKILFIGHKFYKESDVCIICECKNQEKNLCTKIKKCEKMECEKNNIYEYKCCQNLQCISISMYI